VSTGVDSVFLWLMGLVSFICVGVIVYSGLYGPPGPLKEVAEPSSNDEGVDGCFRLLVAGFHCF